MCLAAGTAYARDAAAGRVTETASASDQETYDAAMAWCDDAGIFDVLADIPQDSESTMPGMTLLQLVHRATSADPAVGRPAAPITVLVWAVRNGAVRDLGPSFVISSRPATREQAISALWHAAGSPSCNAPTGLRDEADTAEKAQKAVRWAAAEGLLAGLVSGGELRPKTAITLGETALLLSAYRGAAASILVAYFSATGATRSVAKDIADILEADLYGIRPAEPYTESDLDYAKDCRAAREQKDPKSRPEISADAPPVNMAAYDTIFLGYPIWYGQAPRIISTFLETYDLAGKTIVPFCTSGSSGIGSSADTLHALAPAATWLRGERFAAGTGKAAIEHWLKGLGLFESPAAPENQTEADMLITIGSSVFEAALADTAAAREFASMLRDGPVTIHMSDYSGFEKVGPLGRTLPASNTRITTQSGDIMLYNSNQIVMFYGTNTWSYTPIGKVSNLDGWTDALGSGDIVAVFSLPDSLSPAAPGSSGDAARAEKT